MKENIRQNIVNLISQGYSIKQIRKTLNLSKTAISYHLRLLKQKNIIERIGYGVWIVKQNYNENKFKQVQKEGYGTPIRVKNSVLKSDTIRAHGFQFSVVLPKIRNWDKRRVWLDKKGIKYDKRHNKLVDFEVLSFDNVKVALYDKKLVVYLNESFFCEDSSKGFESAVFELEGILKKVEVLFGVSLRINKGYEFKVDNQHYALIKNGLAREYNKEGRKLQVVAKDGRVWLLIDNSFNINELEAVHPITSKDDVMPVKNFFNSLKEHPITADFVLNSLAVLSKSQEEFMRSQAEYSKNLEAHVLAIKELGRKVDALSELFLLGLKKMGVKNKKLLREGFKKEQRKLFEF